MDLTEEAAEIIKSSLLFSGAPSLILLLTVAAAAAPFLNEDEGVSPPIIFSFSLFEYSSATTDVAITWADAAIVTTAKAIKSNFVPLDEDDMAAAAKVVGVVGWYLRLLRRRCCWFLLRQ